MEAWYEAVVRLAEAALSVTAEICHQKELAV